MSAPKRPTTWLIGSMILLGGVCTVSSERASGDRALIVGIGRYRLAEANLDGIDKDVKMAREAMRLLGFKENQIKVLEDEQATRENIETTFRTWLIDGVGPSDRIAFYFSGHGSQMTDRDGDEPDGLDEFLVPHDFEPVEGGDPRNVILDDTLGEWLSRIPTPHTYVFIDACQSGSSTRGYKGDKFLEYKGMPRSTKAAPRGQASAGFIDKSARKGTAGYLAVAAAADDESALPSEEGSLFTLGLIKALRETVGAGRAVSMNVVKDVSTKVIGDLAKKLSPPGQPHHPQLSGDLARAAEDLRGDTVPPPPADNSVWTMLEEIVNRVPADRRMAIQTNQPEFRLGDFLRLDLVAPADGYVNVINFGEGDAEPTVLFPNQRQTQNRVRTGERVTIPSTGFRLPAQLPRDRSEQRTLVVVVLTSFDLNAYRLGKGSDLLRALSVGAARSFAVEADSDDYYAGKAITVIRR
jgi:caspase domain-containing protein/uncharacterized protein DUF4384